MAPQRRRGEAGAEARGARDPQGLGRLKEALERDRRDMQARLARALGDERNYDAGCSLVRKLRFLDRLEADIDDGLEALGEGP